MVISLKNIKQIVLSILIPLGVGFLSSYITMYAMRDYQSLIKPLYAPKSYIFGIIWPILYILMGIASYRVFNSKGNEKKIKNALLFYIAQLFLNFIWPIIYFSLKMRFAALIEIIILFIFIIITTIKFLKLDKIAGYLMMPYLIWVMYAIILNYYTWILNR